LGLLFAKGYFTGNRFKDVMVRKQSLDPAILIDYENKMTAGSLNIL
jgi:hypothetical protein